MVVALVLIAIAAAAVSVAFSVRISSAPDYREGLVASHRPLSLNPLVSMSDPAAHDVGHALYRGLLRLDDQAVPVADLASAFTISPDGFVYTFTLPSSFQWSDGSRLTVADVAATVAFVQTPGLADGRASSAWNGVKTAIIPADTIRFTLPAPRASFAAALADFPILPLARLDAGGLAALPGHAADPMPASGPFRVVSTDSRLLRLEANPKADPAPRLGHVEFHLFPDFDGAARALNSGDVDAVAATTPAEQSRLAAVPGAQLHRTTTFRFVDLVFNERVPALADPAVRRAMAAAVDRGQIITTALSGAGVPQDTAIPAGVRWAAGGRSPPPDMQDALVALESAGWRSGPDGVRARDGLRLDFGIEVADTAPLPEAARQLAIQYAPLGIALTVHVTPSATFQAAVITPRAFGILLADWDNGADPDVSSYWRSNATPPQGFNLSGGPTDPFLDQALDTLATVNDQRSRRASADRVSSLLGEAAPAVFLYAPADAVAVRSGVGDVTTPEVGGSTARFASLASWSHGLPPGQGRDPLTLGLAAAAIVTALAAVLIAGLRIAGRLVPTDGGSSLERAVVTLVLAVAQVVGVLQLLGALHLLWPASVLVVHVLIAATVVVRVPPPESRAERRRRRPSQGWMAVLVVAIPFAALAIVHGLSGPSGDLQTRSQHIAAAAQWLNAHHTWALPLAVPGDATTSTAPANVDLIALWSMLPVHSDELTYVTNVVFAAICVLSGAIIIRELGASAWKGALAALLVVTAPVSLLTQTRSLLPDLAVAAGVLFAIAVILRGRHAPDSRGWPLLAGLGLGLAVGSDLPALFPVAVVAIWGVVALPRHRLRTAGLILGGMVALGGFWYLRDWVVAGSPIYPVPLRVAGRVLFGGGPDALAFRSTPLLSQLIGLRGGALRHWASAGWHLYGPAPVILMAVVFPVGMVALVWRRPGVVTTVALVPLLVLAYLLTPGTGGGPTGELDLIAGALRYSLPAAVLAMLVCAAVLPTRGWLVAAVAVVFFNVYVAVQPVTRADLGLSPGRALAVAGVIGLLTMIAAIAGGVVSWWQSLRRWQEILCGGLGLAAATAGASLMLHVTETPGQSALSAALDQLGRRDGVVVVIHDPDLRSVLGAHLEVSIASAGSGSPGRQGLITDAAALTARLRDLNPAAVVIGHEGVDALPPGWQPPTSWRLVTILERDARVYVP